MVVVVGGGFGAAIVIVCSGGGYFLFWFFENAFFCDCVMSNSDCLYGMDPMQNRTKMQVRQFVQQ